MVTPDDCDVPQTFLPPPALKLQQCITLLVQLHQCAVFFATKGIETNTVSLACNTVALLKFFHS